MTDAIIMIIFTISSCSVAVLKNIRDTLFLGEKKNVAGMCEIRAAHPPPPRPLRDESPFMTHHVCNSCDGSDRVSL